MTEVVVNNHKKHHNEYGTKQAQTREISKRYKQKRLNPFFRSPDRELPEAVALRRNSRR